MAASRRTYLIFLFILFCAIIARPLFACPMCTELIEHGVDAAKAWRFGLGIGWSILLMLGAPFLMLGGFVFMILRAQKHGPR